MHSLSPAQVRFAYDRIAVLCIGVLVAVRVGVYFQLGGDLPIYGDEGGYVRRLGWLVDAVRQGLGLETGRNRLDRLFATHRMPGLSLWMLPAGLFDLPPRFLRAYLGFADVGLFALVMGLIQAQFGALVSRLYAACWITLPMVNVFAFSFWGDLLAGQLILLLLLWTRARLHQAHGRHWTGFASGLAAGFIFFCRSSTSLLAPLLLVHASLRTAQTATPGTRRSACLVLACCFMAGVGALYLPWAIQSSIQSGRPFLHPMQGLSTEQALSIKTWRASPPDADWGYQRGTAYDARIAALVAAGNTTVAARRAVYEEVAARTTVASRVHASWRNFKNLVRNENQYLAGAFWISGMTPATTARTVPVKRPYTSGGHMVPGRYAPASRPAACLLYANSFLYYVVVLAALACVVLPARYGGRSGWDRGLLAIGLLAQAGMVLAHPGHGRYVFAALPTATLAAALFASGMLTRTCAVPRCTRGIRLALLAILAGSAVILSLR